MVHVRIAAFALPDDIELVHLNSSLWVAFKFLLPYEGAHRPAECRGHCI